MTTTTDLNGLFKEAYADKLLSLVPEQNIIMKSVPFKKGSKLLGGVYHQPVVLRREHGFTYAGANAGAFNLNPAVSMKSQDAQVPGWQLVERSTIDYESVYRSDNVNAFRNAVDLVMENAMESFNYRLEAGMLYGQSATGLGSFGTTTGVDATHINLVFTAAGWAVGLWAEAEGAQIDVFATGASTPTNTTGAMTVTAIDVTTRTVTLSGAAGDVTAIDALTAGFVRFYGANGNEAVGLDAILTNTGTLFNINAAQYNLWKSNVISSVAKTLDGILGAVAVVQGRGLNEDVDILVDPATWNKLVSNEAALRMYDSSFSKAELANGTKKISFYSQNGKLTIHSHTYVKAGEAFLLPMDRLVRIGSTDTTFNIPGTLDGKVFKQLSDAAGFEFRLYSNQGLLLETPAKAAKLVWA